MLNWIPSWAAIKAFVLSYKVIFIVVGLIFVIALAAGMYSCLKPQPKLNEKEIQAAQQAIADHNDAKLKEILAQSDARVQQADANVNAAHVNTAAAEANREAVESNVHNYDGWTHDQLAAEMEKRAHQ
jgi:uncharacterized protein HemX